jgi:hypothetical protein
LGFAVEWDQSGEFVDLMRRTFALATWKKRLLAIALASALALIFIELALRLLGVSFQDFYKADPVRGVAHRPGARGWFRREGRQYIVINREGFRDREHPAIKPPGSYRIALLGDSFTEALQVRLEDTFGAVLERELARCPGFRGRSVEVFNFGVSNYGTAQELLTLRERVWQVEPDLVLLAFFSGNDVWDNSKELKQDPELPYFSIFHDGGGLILDKSFQDSPRQAAEQSSIRVAIKNLIESFRILQVVRQAWGVLRSKSAGNGAPASGDEFAGTEAQRQIFAEPTDPAWRDAWAVTERLIKAMNDEVTSHGANFAVVTLTNAAQVHPDPAVSERFRERLGVPDLDYPDRRIQELGAFPVLNLAPYFRDHARANHDYLHGFPPNLGAGHWNEKGHALAGRLIAEWLCSREKSGEGR